MTRDALEPLQTTRQSVKTLVVDDDLNSRTALALLLDFEGYAVEVCESGAHALQRLTSAPYALLLTDYVMPDISGLALVAAARALRPALRCFIISGTPRPESFQDASVEWIAKPLDFDRLVQRIRDALR